jgi:hypothetical protein
VSTFGLASTVSCTPNSVFKRGMRLVWRFEIVDVSTGKRVTDQDGATVVRPPTAMRSPPPPSAGRAWVPMPLM